MEFGIIDGIVWNYEYHKIISENLQPEKHDKEEEIDGKTLIVF